MGRSWHKLVQPQLQQILNWQKLIHQLLKLVILNLHIIATVMLGIALLQVINTGLIHQQYIGAMEVIR